ncbi:polyhydroxyalkanoic acid system family protein [Caenimonas sp. SL110]|uniref:polyhydroxyalkanoic acid system family protein n=1 Tax=Caenimonas sp. SL110 TaxID=1450524 RepID=UPI000653E3ED|nr:polyhydroxyalkanoic acid system family protein [Caenimonas sp. SL110]
MPDIHITRKHALGLPEARKLAFRWAELAEERFDMECTYEEGKTSDLVSFTRSGVNGELKVTKDHFALDARLGFLLGAFRERIESEIVKNLDLLLAQEEPLKAFDEEVARRTAGKKEAKTAAAKAVPEKKSAPKKKA